MSLTTAHTDQPGDSVATHQPGETVATDQPLAEPQDDLAGIAAETVEVVADRVEQPSTFADFGVQPAIVAALAAHGITHPFPIQAMTLPVALSGDGTCVLATYSTPGVTDACWRGPVA